MDCPEPRDRAPGSSPSIRDGEMPVRLPAQRMDMLMAMPDVWRAAQQASFPDRPVLPADAGKKIPVMGNDHPGRGQVAQNVDEPLPGLLVQIIGGLVQQQGLRFHGQYRGQRHQTDGA